MITDPETNFLYLSGLLEKENPKFYERLTALLDKLEINYDFLPDTRNIWARDYMPVQVSDKSYIQFKYDPRYIHDIGEEDTITDPIPVCGNIGITAETRYDLVIDGGNIVKWKDKVIVTDFLYKYNNAISRKAAREYLWSNLNIENVIVIPHENYDYTGHADGMVRFLDENNVLVNDFRNVSKTFQSSLNRAFRVNKLNPIEFPYAPAMEKTGRDYPATGCYMNFLWIGRKIIIPIFNLRDEDRYINKINTILKGYEIHTLESSEIADKGGVLNCISWNIKRIDKS